MVSPYLLLALLGALSFTLATQLDLWSEQSHQGQESSGSVLQILMGDSQRLFANHFLVKADVYLHSGFYPSIFDQAQQAQKSHLAKAAQSATEQHPPGTRESAADDSHVPSDHHSGSGEPHEDDEHDAASGFFGKPKDWIDSFGRNFYPTHHTHLGKVNQREILPWLRLAARLNPNQVESYTVGAYWLRNRMGKVKEAESFLREGWRANPDSFEILLDLGRLNEEDKHDLTKARNLYEAALVRWQKSESSKPEPDGFSFMQITGHLARLEEREGHLPQACHYLEMLRSVSPHPEVVQKQIDELQSKFAPQSSAQN